MDFAMLPPEVNSGRMYSGPGAGPMLAAATAWDTLAGELHTAGAGYEATLGDLGIGWSGSSAAAMAAAAAPYVTWMRTTALQAERAAAQAMAAAGAYEAAFAMTVPPPVIAANRAQLMTLVATNFLGQNTPAIAATEAHYAEMWAQDAVAMYNYAGSAAAASVLQPFASAPQTTNPAGSAGPVAGHPPAAIAQLSTVPNALQGLAAPAAAVGSTSQPLPGTLGPGLGSAAALAPAVEALVVELFSAFIVDSVGTFGIDAIGTFVIDAAGAVIGEMEALELPLIGLAGWSSPLTAGLAQAASIGALSVPSAWTVAVPSALQQAGTALAAAGTATGPTLAAVPFAPMASAGMAGGATAAAGHSGRGGGTGVPKQKRPKAAQPAQPERPAPRVKALPGGPITGISGKLRRLAKLREVGILSEEKFTEKKRLLLDQHSPT